MPRLTPAELDALEAAHKAATPGEIRPIPNAGIDDDPDEKYWALEGGTGYYGYPKPGFRLTGFISPDDIRLIALAHNALPALIAAARATVPEPIGEKHRDGETWQCYFPGLYRWVPVYYYEKWQEWRSPDGAFIMGTPTHALPMPPAPEGADA